MKYSLNQIEHLYAIAVHGSFAAAAETLGISKAQMSLSIAKLERALGTKLLHRTTRSVSLTQAGELLMPLIESIINTKKMIEQEVQLLHEEPAGMLKVTCPAAFAEIYLTPAIPDFLNQFPNLTLDLRLTTQLVDLEKERIDVAIRLTHEPPLDRIAKQLGHYQLGYFATPTYLAQRGRPQCIDELKDHVCLVSNSVLKGPTWVFEVADIRKEITVNALLRADSHHVIKHALLSHSGITCLPYFMLENEMKAQQVVPLFEAYLLKPIPIYAIYTRTRKLEAKTQCFLEFLRSVLPIQTTSL